MKKGIITLLFSVVALTAGCPTTNEFVNVSYDPTRELYAEFNQAFIEHYKKQTGVTVNIRVTHDGSSKQARAVVEGIPCDVVTLALAYDIDFIAKAGFLRKDWQQQFPNNSSPYTSTVVFLVRKGNPKNIKGWDDLIQPNVGVIVANPKTSGVARWAYLAAWGAVLKNELGDLTKLDDPEAAEEVAAAQEKAKEYIVALYKNVKKLDKGARDASLTFTRNKLGDVLLDWENQAELTINEVGKDEYEIVVPSVSILAEPPVAIVDKNVDERGTRKIAQAYLEFLYSDEGQELVAKHYYRPRNEEILKKYADNFVKVDMFTIDHVFGGWEKAHQKHFADGGIFDQIYVKPE